MPAAPAIPAWLDYTVVDVFTDRPFTGNALAVVHGADSLTTGQMQSIASEFNLSETAFPLQLSKVDIEAGADYRVRIFTPGGEVPFAGHPTVGTAWTLGQRGDIAPGPRVQACAAGLIGVRLPADPASPVELSAAPRDLPRRLSLAEVDEVAPLVGLEVADVVGSGYLAGCGLTWLYLQVHVDAVSRARPSGRRVSEVAVDQTGLRDPLDGINVFAVSSEAPNDGSDVDFGGQAGVPLEISSRVFVPGFGIPEDPATGSAAAGLGLVLVESGLAREDGATSYRISQGVEMGRAAVLMGRVEARHGEATMVHVAGQVVPVASGMIRVP